MTNLGIAHILIGGKANGFTVSLERCRWRDRSYTTKIPHVRSDNGVAVLVFPYANSIHYHQNERTTALFPH
jgi:hypothetical protein